MSTRERIFVGLSGGVDSSVAAMRLCNEGHDVVGVFIKVWQPDFIQCNWERERLDAMRVAAHLGIPFLTFDAEAVYKQEVADYMIREYSEGRTPNPDVMCNEQVKFGAFLRFALNEGADKIATGHYARVGARDGRPFLIRGADRNKDQSYFLWKLNEYELSHVIFPIGDTRKEVVRKEAESAGLPTFQKRDSQGVCFLGQIDMKEFLSHYIQASPGPVLDVDGNAIGSHQGALFYTLGERHGFTLHEQSASRAPHYVIAKNSELNTITVDTTPPIISGAVISLTDSNLRDISIGEAYEAQLRYRQRPFTVKVLTHNESYATLEVADGDVDAPSVGQSCVLYDGAYCLGGGIIS